MSTDALDLAIAHRQTFASWLSDWMDGGTLTLYTDPPPAGADAAIGEAVALAVFEFQVPSGTAMDGVWNADPLPEPAEIQENGRATWARLRAQDGSTVGDGSVGLTGSGAAITLQNTDLVVGYSVVCTSCGIAI